MGRKTGPDGRRGLAGAAFVLVALASAPAGAATIRGGDPGKWGPPALGTGAEVSWSVMGGGLATDNGLSVDPDAFLPGGYQDAIAGAFGAWSEVADLSFSPAPDPGVGWLDPGADAVDIRIGFRPYDGPGSNLGFAYYPLSSNGAGAGDIFIDSDESWTLGSGPDLGFSLRRLVVHEVGHSLGLDHSFFGTAMYPYYDASWEEPQSDDIEGIQTLYGPPAPVPLPAGLPLLAGGLALLGLWGRGRA